LFFSTLSISAYLLKSVWVVWRHGLNYIRLAFILEYRIPSCNESATGKEGIRRSLYQSLWGLLLVLSCPRYYEQGVKNRVGGIGTDIGATLEDNRLVTRTFTICKCTYSLGGLVWEAGKHIIESLETKALQKPLAIEKSIRVALHPRN
jgi:hypothetical protein